MSSFGAGSESEGGAIGESESEGGARQGSDTGTEQTEEEEEGQKGQGQGQREELTEGGGDQELVAEPFGFARNGSRLVTNFVVEPGGGPDLLGPISVEDGHELSEAILQLRVISAFLVARS